MKLALEVLVGVFFNSGEIQASLFPTPSSLYAKLGYPHPDSSSLLNKTETDIHLNISLSEWIKTFSQNVKPFLQKQKAP